MKNIFIINNQGLISEYYYIGETRSNNYAVFAGIRNHEPIRIHKPTMFEKFYKNKEDAIKKAISNAEFTITLLKN